MGMLSDASDLAKRIFNNDVFQRALFPVMAVVAVLLYVGSFYIDEQLHKPLREGLKSLAEVMLTTGLISMFINAFTYMGVFREALSGVFVSHRITIRDAADEALVGRRDTIRTIMDEAFVARDGFIKDTIEDVITSNQQVIRGAVHDVLYSLDHLKCRTDLPVVWGRVSEALYGQRFPALAEPLKDTILSLLPMSSDFYYAEYNRECFVRWKDRNLAFVELQEDIDDLVIVPTSPDITINYSYKTEADSRTPQNIARVELRNLTVDDQKYENVIKEEEYDDLIGGRGLRQSYSILLRGRPRYRVKRTLVRTIALNKDPIVDYRSPNFILGPTSIRVHAEADDLKVHVVGNASKDFADLTGRSTFWDAHLEYHGLIFPNEGYILFLQKL